MNDKKYLQWLATRLVEVHGENPNYDYIHKLVAIIDATPESQCTLMAATGGFTPVDLSQVDPLKMATFHMVSINSLQYEVPEEVAEQFTKFIRRSNTANAEIEAGLEREEGMVVAISNLQRQLQEQNT